MEMERILLCSTELAAQYDTWSQYENVIEILENSNTNKLLLIIEKNNPQLCKKAIHSIMLSFYINMYLFINEIQSYSC